MNLVKNSYKIYTKLRIKVQLINMILMIDINAYNNIEIFIIMPCD